jgi:cytochrome P450
VSRSSVWQQILDYSNRADPYPLYAELRKTPVLRAEDGSYVVSTYQEIVALLHDPRLSSDVRNFPGYDADAQASEGDLPGAPEPPESHPARLPPPPHRDRRRQPCARPCSVTLRRTDPSEPGRTPVPGGQIPSHHT